MDDDHVFNEEHLREDFVNDDEEDNTKVELFNECLTVAKEEEHAKRACSLYHCVLEKGIVDFGDYHDEHDDH